MPLKALKTPAIGEPQSLLARSYLWTPPICKENFNLRHKEVIASIYSA
jgi:hypothetical protein